MTPEERAAKIVKDENWYFDDYYFDGEDERPTSTIDRDILRDEIIAAIQQAIIAEREACAIAAEMQDTWAHDRPYEVQVQVQVDMRARIAAAIRARK